LWALAEHLRLSGQELDETGLKAAEWIVEYLSALWRIPCFDCWEEYPDKVHAHTLASIRGGLEAYGRISGDSRTQLIDEIDSFLQRELLRGNHFVKFVGSEEVDASLLGLATPFCFLNPDDPLMLATVSRIEEDLMCGGGLHRYKGDTYYGGGEWVLLTAWLGWYHVERGNLERARHLLGWVESQADIHGNLPEQISLNLNDPNYLQPWRERWGEIARPLLWSHAKYLILEHALSSA
jgi:GH15 family glucan-1,4-alpha-glucosidase